ncbi:MAG: type IX secretion system outer membrane channel protein PorV [Bacteroidetes bacterium]|nr:type IX secretion system outer membrane channel protein PorV [Bacteroidota bacterium]
MKNPTNKFALFLLGCLLFTGAYTQAQLNTITTAVPFLMIAPDARSGGLGDAGVASTPDASSLHWNPAKYAFIEKEMGISVSYSPWLRALVNDINLAYLSGYKKFGNDQAIAASLLFFSMGDITFTDIVGNTIGQFKPSEYAFDACYSRKLSENFSGGVSLRYIHSNLTGGQYVGGAQSHAGNSVATDVSSYYQKEFKIKETPAKLGLGINLSNIGAKISYTETTIRDFIPMNLRLGGALTVDIDAYNSIALIVDANKLLVPTPPIYQTDSSNMPLYGSNGKPLIQSGKDPNVGIVSGIFQSFADAPNGFKEEISEISLATGIEYWYDKQFAIRAGFFYEDKDKGNRKFFTVGAGLKYNVFGLDFAYLIPVEQRNPLENTLRFTLLFDFDAFKDQNAPPMVK